MKLFCKFSILSYYLLLVCVFYRSFNDKPINEAANGPIGKELFEMEQDDLISDLKDIPKKACDRRVSHLFLFAYCIVYSVFQPLFFGSDK